VNFFSASLFNSKLNLEPFYFQPS